METDYKILTKKNLDETLNLLMELDEDRPYILSDKEEVKNFIGEKWGNFIAIYSKQEFEKFYAAVNERIIRLAKNSDKAEIYNGKNETEILEILKNSFRAKVRNESGEEYRVEVRSISKLVERYSGENLSNSL